MTPSRMRRILFALVLFASPGCTWDRLMSVGNRGYADPTAQSSDPWVGQAGAEGRGNRKRESSRDPLDKILWSEKAHEINRNLGVDE